MEQLDIFYLLYGTMIINYNPCSANNYVNINNITMINISCHAYRAGERVLGARSDFFSKYFKHHVSLGPVSDLISLAGGRCAVRVRLFV